MKKLFTTVALAGLLATGAVCAQTTTPTDSNGPNSPRAGNVNNQAGTIAPGASSSRLNSGDSGTSNDPNDGATTQTVPATGPTQKSSDKTHPQRKDVGTYHPNGTAADPANH